MTNYKLRYLPTFYDDLEETVDYIAGKLRNPSAAMRLADKVEAAIQERLIAPISFEVYKSRKKRKRIYYRIYVDNYMVLYVVIGEVMEVRRLIYQKRDLESELE